MGSMNTGGSRGAFAFSQAEDKCRTIPAEIPVTYGSALRFLLPQ